MTASQVTQLGSEILMMTLMLSAPIILAGMFVGVFISIFQAVTQVQEQSLSFVVKVAASGAAFIFFSPWMLRKLMDFAVSFLGNLDKFAH
jgi:flagellar biosynthetic protein FliQ